MGGDSRKVNRELNALLAGVELATASAAAAAASDEEDTTSAADDEIWAAVLPMKELS